VLCSLESAQRGSYFSEMVNRVRLLSSAFTMLLALPTQRTVQEDALFSKPFTVAVSDNPDRPLPAADKAADAKPAGPSYARVAGGKTAGDTGGAAPANAAAAATAAPPAAAAPATVDAAPAAAAADRPLPELPTGAAAPDLGPLQPDAASGGSP